MEEPIAVLLESYGFELVRGETARETVARWLAEVQADWVRSAVLEALYQGRYKAISVDQILQAWQRRGEPVHHFSLDFERLICQNLPRRMALPVDDPDAEPNDSDNRRPVPPGAIARFSPQPDASALYSKLQSAAHQPESDVELDVELELSEDETSSDRLQPEM